MTDFAVTRKAVIRVAVIVGLGAAVVVAIAIGLYVRFG